MDSISYSVTDFVRTDEVHEHSDDNRNQGDLLAQCTALGDCFIYVCSQKTAVVLAASLKSQVVSESILETNGNLVAQFERWLDSTAPVDFIYQTGFLMKYYEVYLHQSPPF
uniref:Uncharacterized protein n=1 Tax=Arundo donax TaxID=35708 RepID=A0A0A9H6R0_ARUDO